MNMRRVVVFGQNLSFYNSRFTLIEMFGHTPGHSLFRLSGAKCTVIFCADMGYSSELQFKNPYLEDGFEIDKKKGLENRPSFYNTVADENIVLVGARLPYPGLGKLRKSKDTYVFNG